MKIKEAINLTDAYIYKAELPSLSRLGRESDNSVMNDNHLSSL